MPNITKTAFWTITAVAFLTAMPAAAQENWPDGPIQVIVPFGAGGDTDFNARVLSKYLEPQLGVSMPVINVTGAGGSIGARQALDAAADGQTVLFFHSAMLVNTASGMSEFSWKDFELAGIAGREPGGLIVVKADAPWQSLTELVEASNAEPASIDLTTNSGATTYLVGSLLNQAGAQFNFVDVGGSADRLTAVLGGNVDVSQNPLGQVKPYLESGELRALGALSAERTEALPDVPTVIEQGYDVSFQYDYFYLFPKGTPQEIVGKFGEAVRAVVEDNSDYAAEIRGTYFQEPYFLSADDAAAKLTETEAQIGAVAF